MGKRDQIYPFSRRIAGLCNEKTGKSGPFLPLVQQISIKSDRLLVERLTELVGLDYAHGWIDSAVVAAGVGCTAKTRRELAARDTPWGCMDDESEELAPGILSVITATHGGLLLSPERNTLMPAHLRYDNRGYEEDGEFYLVALGFPDEAETMGISLRSALANLHLVDRCKASGGGEANALTSPLSDMESKIIAYLVACVHANVLPLRFPSEPAACDDIEFGILKTELFTLSDWVTTYEPIPTIEGRWATRPGPWYRHWAWRERDAARQAALDREWEKYRIE